MDRIDIHVQVPVVSYEALRQKKRGETSAKIRERVEVSRGVQQQRFRDRAIHANAQMEPADLREHCAIDEAGHVLLKRVVDQLGMSARAYDRILKVARTIADLEGSADVAASHLSEAIQYRLLDRDVSSRAA